MRSGTTGWLKGPGTSWTLAARRGGVALSLAARADSVVGFDANRHAVAMAVHNAQGVDNLEFFASAWVKGFSSLAGRAFDTAVVNPMRQPLESKALGALGALRPQQLIYLGPSPAAAAKDIGTLRGAGWRLERLGAADLHPQTYHVMLVASLRRG